ncbi:hypothetical protein QQF64_017600 [Cirrhinus molitorella]|uniref:EF-hand domain-containing protein n=5 Tax=Cyprinidae TaxID=7953 RepID=A0ABR3LJ47_9TELE
MLSVSSIMNFEEGNILEQIGCTTPAVQWLQGSAPISDLISTIDLLRQKRFGFFPACFAKRHTESLRRVKMPFHHVRAGLLYTDNFLSTSLSETSEEQLANISTEELGEIREAFRVLDRDGNGFISKQELGMAMRSLGYMPSEVELAIIMQRLDMDGDGQVDFDEFMTILGPKLVSSETREGFLGSTIDSIFWQFDMQQMSLEELKHVLFHAFRDHLTMKDIENIIVTEEESLKENSGNCQTEFQGVHSKKKNRQTCVRKSLICAFAMAFIISVMLIAANQMLRNGME